MARIRSVHPGLWTDEAFVSVSMGARLLFIGILNECDDQGAFEWKPVTLKMRLAPADNVDIPTMLRELADVDLIRNYQSGAGSYGAVRHFRQWQRPKKPNSVHPMPDGLRSYSGLKHGGSEPDDDHERVDTPPVPSELPTSGEIPPQMEDGGWRRLDGGENTGLRPTPSARDVVWSHGLPILIRLSGLTPAKARSLLGRFVKDAGDDCAAVMAALADADQNQPIEPVAWLTEAVKARTGRRQSSLDRIAKDWDLGSLEDLDANAERLQRENDSLAPNRQRRLIQ